jgi:hypothetical protein
MLSLLLGLYIWLMWVVLQTFRRHILPSFSGRSEKDEHSLALLTSTPKMETACTSEALTTLPTSTYSRTYINHSRFPAQSKGSFFIATKRKYRYAVVIQLFHNLQRNYLNKVVYLLRSVTIHNFVKL